MSCIKQDVCAHLSEEARKEEACIHAEVCRFISIPEESALLMALEKDAVAPPSVVREVKAGRKKYKGRTKGSGKKPEAKVFDVSKEGIAAAKLFLLQRKSFGEVTEDEVRALTPTHGVTYNVLTEGHKEQIVEIAEEVQMRYMGKQ